MLPFSFPRPTNDSQGTMVGGRRNRGQAGTEDGTISPCEWMLARNPSFFCVPLHLHVQTYIRQSVRPSEKRRTRGFCATVQSYRLLSRVCVCVRDWFPHGCVLYAPRTFPRHTMCIIHEAYSSSSHLCCHSFFSSSRNQIEQSQRNKICFSFCFPQQWSKHESVARWGQSPHS